MVNITAGPNITISGSVISASGGSGGGNVTGPESSTNHGLALFNGTSGELLLDQSTVFTPANNSLIGYGTSTAVENVTIGTGLSLSSGVLSSTASGSGNVSGPSSAVVNTPAVYGNVNGKEITTTSVTVTPNTIIGYNGSSMSNISAGNGLTIQNGLISALASPSIAGQIFSSYPILIGTNSPTLINDADPSYNVGGVVNVSDPNYLTAPISGLYIVDFQIQFLMGSSASYTRSVTLSINLNGSPYQINYVIPTSQDAGSFLTTWIGYNFAIKLNANDVITYYASVGSGVGTVTNNLAIMSLYRVA